VSADSESKITLQAARVTFEYESDEYLCSVEFWDPVREYGLALSRFFDPEQLDSSIEVMVADQLNQVVDDIECELTPTIFRIRVPRELVRLADGVTAIDVVFELTGPEYSGLRRVIERIFIDKDGLTVDGRPKAPRSPRDPDMKAIVDAILAERDDYGDVHVQVGERDPAEPVDQARQSFLRERGFSSPRGDWLEVPATEAEMILTNILNAQQAYGNEIMPVARAQELARGFVGLFGDKPRFFTNGHPAKRGAQRFVFRLTGATFDWGIFVVGTNRLGLLWVGDED
jgi:hypothetical protein